MFDDVDHWYVITIVVLLVLVAVLVLLVAFLAWRRRRRRGRACSVSLCSAIRNGGPESKTLSSHPGSLLSIASTTSSRSTAPLIQAYMVGGDVTIPERRHSTRSVNIEPGQIRSECYTNDVTDDGMFNPFKPEFQS